MNQLDGSYGTVCVNGSFASEEEALNLKKFLEEKEAERERIQEEAQIPLIMNEGDIVKSPSEDELKGEYRANTEKITWKEKLKFFFT